MSVTDAGAAAASAALGIGSLVGAVSDPTHDRFGPVAKIGSGLSDAAWKALRKRLDVDATRRRNAPTEREIIEMLPSAARDSPPRRSQPLTAACCSPE